MEWKNIAPWNWFRKEEEHEAPVPARRAPDPIEALHREMDRTFEELFRRFGGGPLAGASASGRPALDEASRLRPRIDISEGCKAYTLRVEVPGVEKDDVTLQVEDDTLLVRGEKRREKEEGDESYHCIERSYGRFERVLSLPEDADGQAISAGFRNGVLKVKIPKRAVPEKPGRAIEITHE